MFYFGFHIVYLQELIRVIDWIRFEKMFHPWQCTVSLKNDNHLHIFEKWKCYFSCTIRICLWDRVVPGNRDWNISYIFVAHTLKSTLLFPKLVEECFMLLDMRWHYLFFNTFCALESIEDLLFFIIQISSTNFRILHKALCRSELIRFVSFMLFYYLCAHL